MTNFLLEHKKECAPMNPCVSCRAVTFLREKLSREDFEELEKLAVMVKSSASVTGVAVTPIALDASVDVLELTTRPAVDLRNEKIFTIGDLVAKTEAEMLRTPNFGRATVHQIKRALARVGRSFGETPPPT